MTRNDPAARELLADRHGLAHVTVQVEPPRVRTRCHELSW